MAPIEFEKQIKERLDERKIKPSSKAWDKVKENIDIPTSGKKPGIYRYAVAAAIVGVLISVFWISSKTETEVLDRQPVVENPVTPEAESIKLDGPQIDSQNGIVEQIEEEPIDNIPAPDRQKARDLQMANKDIAMEDQDEESQHPTLSLPQEELIDKKIAEVIAQVDLLENSQESLTDAEVDSLLRNAQQELMAEKALQSEQEVDAEELLAGIEEELDKSFRDQVLERLKNGYIKVRTAVADRNN